eukprot:GHVU01029450.1.p6 GENE.GHVU01029450.1~~GHVU01029450.1.p6  ORF type:complete len:117 (+),score=28.14 GHVU01029450.1:2341-2691(+)
MAAGRRWEAWTASMRGKRTEDGEQARVRARSHDAPPMPPKQQQRGGEEAVGEEEAAGGINKRQCKEHIEGAHTTATSLGGTTPLEDGETACQPREGDSGEAARQIPPPRGRGWERV